MSAFDRKIKQILKRTGVDQGVIDAVQDEIDQKDVTLVEALQSQSVIEPKELLGLVSCEIGVPALDLSSLEFDQDFAELLSQELATKHAIVPLSKIGSCLTVVVADPFDVVKVEDLSIETELEIRTVVGLESQIQDALGQIYRPQGAGMENLLEDLGDTDVELREAAQEADENLSLDEEGLSPAVKVVNAIVFNAVRDGASDIHIEPFEKTVKVRYRQDGVLKEVLSPPKNLQSAITSRIKIMCGLDIAERRKPQDGKFQVKIEGRQVDFRVSTLPMVHGEKVVLRILDASNLSLSLDSLGFEQKSLEDYRAAITSPYGMILITGPTGSGKSTTLYSALREIYSPEVNIVTVEDPVEYQIEGVNQVPVNPKRELTFGAALRSILRQDPDVILLGEIRDRETVEIAVKAALTGHLVLSTLHTNDAPSTVTRMIDMGLDPFLVSSSVLLICAQRLALKLCDQCKRPVELPEDRLVNLGYRPEDMSILNLHQAGDGCSRCSGGYKGRFALLESLPFTEGVRRKVIEGASSLELKRTALQEGMISLRRAGLMNAARGKTSIEEIVRVTLADD